MESTCYHYSPKKDLHTADYTQLYDFLKYNQKEVEELRAERLAKTHDPLALMANSNNPFNYRVFHQDQPSPSTFMQQPQPNKNYNPKPSFNQNYTQQPMSNPKYIIDPTTAMNMALILMAKAFKLNYSTATNNNQRISSNPRNRQIAQPGMNMGQDRQMKMVGGNGGNQFGQYGGLNVRNPIIQNAVQNLARAEVRQRRRDAAYLQTQLLISQKEEAGIQLQAEEFDLMVAAGDLDEIEEVNVNYILMANLQQASTSGTQTDKAPVYDSDISAEVQISDNCYNNDIFNMFTQKEQYTELLEPIPEPHQVQQNDSNVIYEVPSVEQGGGTVEQHLATVGETHAYFESLYNNLAIKVEKVNTVNRKLRETNADLTTELARYKNQEKCFEISQEKYDKLERCYQKSVYQEQCLTKKINALHLSSGKQITTLNEEIANLNNQLSKEKSIVSFLNEEKKKLKSDFKIREDELLDKQIQLENKIKELDNILVKTGQSIQTMHMLSPKPDSFYHTEQKMALGYQNPFYLKQAQQKQQSLYNGKVLLEKHDPPVVYDSEETLQLAQESRLKMKQLNKEIKPANYTKINHLSGVFVSQTAKSREELYFSNTSKTANVSKSISIPNEEFSDDTTPSVARKFLNEVKSTIVTLQRVVKQKMTLDIHNWSSSVHQEIHKIVKDEIFPIVNQVDARLQNFKIQFLKEAAKFVRDFKYLAKEADESLAKYKALELEIECLLRAVFSQDIMSIVQTKSSSASKSSCSKNKEVEVEEHLRNLLLSKNKKHMSSECNNINLAIQNDKSDVVCAMCHSKFFMFLGTVRFGNDHVAAIQGYGDLQWGNILITRVYFGNRTTNLYTINLHEMASASLICLMARATSTKSWLWHQRLSHLNFETINDLAKNDLITALPKFKYHKEHLCPSCEQGKSKRASHPPKPVPNSKQRLHLLHMDLCGPMRVASINGKRVGISHQASSVRKPQQNGAVERRNRTIVEAARPMLIFSRAPLFLWAEAIATACYTQNRSIIHRRFVKTPYELINGRKPDISFLHVFGALCYPKNDREDIRKLGAK
ncbi:retrovirus-related pol polyprotein from transposon TNT 1-94 [Tanacetum coccineum]